MSPLLAHSARPKRGIPEQTYADHIGNVVGAAVVNEDLIKHLDGVEKVSRDDLQSGSVQIWQDRANDWGAGNFEFIRGLKKWSLPYDSFLGYMAGVLPLVDGGQHGFII